MESFFGALMNSTFENSANVFEGGVFCFDLMPSSISLGSIAELVQNWL
jgi:hypothetical protein